MTTLFWLEAIKNEKQIYGKGKDKQFKEKYTVVAGLRNICFFRTANLQYRFLILKHIVDLLRMTYLL